MRRYAQDTPVPISRSRGEIDSLLRSWGADGVQWTDEWTVGKITLRFIWPKDGVKYQARFVLQLPTDEQVRTDPALRNRWGEVAAGKLDKALAARGKSEHRLLLLWLKAAFNAVDAGLVSAEVLFLPFLEGSDGQTVAERALPNLPHLLIGSADKLLTAPKAKA